MVNISKINIHNTKHINVFTMPIHRATQSNNQAWTLNEYPSFTKSINHGLRTLVLGPWVQQ